MLESRLICLERKNLDTSSAAKQLRAEILEHKRHIGKLSGEIVEIENRRHKISEEGSEEIFINWDGTFSAAGRVVKFDNAGQAKRIIQHLVRRVLSGENSINCLCGFMLFDWDMQKFRSDPHRLFNTAISKLNGPIKKLGLPPLLSSGGRGSFSWKLVWDKSLLIGKSATGIAGKKVFEAREAGSSSEPDVVDRLISEALMVDPLCLDAVNFLAESIGGRKEVFSNIPRELRGRLKNTAVIIAKEIETTKRAVAALEGIPSAVDLKTSVYADNVRQELAKTRLQLGNLETVFEFLQGDMKCARSVRLSNLINTFKVVQEEILIMKENGAPRHDVWGKMVGNYNFISFISSPVISPLVNNFYNDDLNQNEDARLVQLALIWLLEDRSAVDKLSAIQSEGDFKTHLRKLVRTQLNSLNNELGAMPEHC